MSNPVTVNRCWSTLLLLALAIPLLHAPTSQAKPTEPIEVRGRTTFTGSRTASIPIHIPRDVVVNSANRYQRLSGPNPSIRIQGAGRFVGVVLVPDPHVPGSEPQWPVVIGQFRECDRPGCDSRRVHNYLDPDFYGDKDGLLFPGGDYRAHLITDRARARVTISFSGLSGQTILRPQHPSPVDLQTPTQALASDGRNLWSAGSGYDAGSVGFSLSATWVKLESQSQGFNMGVCQIQWPTAPPAEAYGPHCTYLGAGALWGSLVPIDDDEFVLISYFGYNDQGEFPESIDGRFGYGAWFESRSVPIKRVGNTTFFLQTADTWE